MSRALGLPCRIACLASLLGIGPVAHALGDDRAAPRAFGYDNRPDFLAFRPDYRERKERAARELERLQADLIAQQRRGRKTPCSRQVWFEAKWLIYNTADFDRADRRLADLRRRLAEPADPHDRSQVEADGSFGCCTEEWFLRLNETVDVLIGRGAWLRPPKHPMRFLDRVNSPEKLRAYLDSLLVSDVRKTGADRRFELNMGVSGLVRLVLWRGTWKELPTNYDLDEGLAATLLDFIKNRWQDPATGFFGGQYRAADESIVRTADLSQTFHIVSYLDGEVGHWPEIVRTTLAMKGGEWPHGWLEDGAMANHHNYDIAALFRRGWPHASPAQRDAIRVELRRMLDWCLRETIDEDGGFRIMASDAETLGSAFYFGVAFLDEVGYFARSKRFWTDEEFPRSAELRDKIRRKMKSLGLDDNESRMALMLLARSQLAP